MIKWNIVLLINSENSNDLSSAN